MADKHPGFVRGTEAYLAAVWYVMKDAEAAYEKHKAQIERGQRGPWGFLNKVRNALGYPQSQVSYRVMREDLIAFATEFGVEGAPTLKSAEAAVAFGPITKED